MQFRVSQSRTNPAVTATGLFRDLQMVVDVKTVCAVSVKEEAVLVKEVKTIIEQ